MASQVFRKKLQEDETIWRATIGVDELRSFLYDPKAWLHANVSSKAAANVDTHVVRPLSGPPDSDDIVLSGIEGTSTVCLEVGGRAAESAIETAFTGSRSVSSIDGMLTSIAGSSVVVESVVLPEFGEVNVNVPLGSDAMASAVLVEALRSDVRFLVDWYNGTTLDKTTWTVGEDGLRHEIGTKDLRLVVEGAENIRGPIAISVRAEPLSVRHQERGYLGSALIIQAKLIEDRAESDGLACEPYLIKVVPIVKR